MNKTVVFLLALVCMFTFACPAFAQTLHLPDKYAMTEYASITKSINDYTAMAKDLEKSKKKKDQKQKKRLEKKVAQLKQELEKKLAAKEQEIKEEIKKYEGKIKTDRANAKTYKIFLADLNTDLLRLKAFKQARDFDPANPNPPPAPATATDPKGASQKK